MNKQSEISYFAFVVGYEMLNNIKNNNIKECDLMYNFAYYIAEMFINSEEYENVKFSGYEMLYYFIDNKGGIEKLYKDYFNIKEEN